MSNIRNETGNNTTDSAAIRTIGNTARNFMLINLTNLGEMNELLEKLNQNDNLNSHIAIKKNESIN